MQRISLEEIFSEIRVRVKHGLLEAFALVKGLVAVADLEDELTESKRTFYLISLMLFLSLLLISPDKIPQTLAASDLSSGALDKIQEIVKKVVPFIG